jgi:hypothetical protein
VRARPDLVSFSRQPSAVRAGVDRELAGTEINRSPSQGADLAAPHTAEHAKQDRDEDRMRPRRLQQFGRGRGIQHGHLLALDPWWLDGIARVSGQQPPAYSLSKSLLQNSVQMRHRPG